MAKRGDAEYPQSSTTRSPAHRRNRPAQRGAPLEMRKPASSTPNRAVGAITAAPNPLLTNARSRRYGHSANLRSPTTSLSRSSDTRIRYGFPKAQLAKRIGMLQPHVARLDAGDHELARLSLRRCGSPGDWPGAPHRHGGQDVRSASNRATFSTCNRKLFGLTRPPLACHSD